MQPWDICLGLLIYVYIFSHDSPYPVKKFESCQKVIGILDMAIIDHWQKFEYDPTLTKIIWQIVYVLVDQYITKQCVQWYYGFSIITFAWSTASFPRMGQSICFCIEKGHPWRIRVTIDTTYPTYHRKCGLVGGPL